MTTNITEQHREAFEALTSGNYGNFALFSCFVDGEPSAAIVAVEQMPEGDLIQPLFVAVTEAMGLTDHDGRPAGCGDEPQTLDLFAQTL
jgi:hypothetical protein